MASPDGSDWLLRPVRVLLVSAGVAAIATALKVSVIPLIWELSSSHLPPLMSSLLAWFRPPYLYVVINAIIIIIAASSRFQWSHHELIPAPPEEAMEVGVEVVEAGGDVSQPGGVYEEKRVVVEVESSCLTIEDGGSDGDDEAEESVVSRLFVSVNVGPAWPPLSPAMQPPVSSSSVYRKSLSGISQGPGKNARGRKSERHETMEATWKAITEGRDVTKTAVVGRLSRCDLWDDREERQISSLDQLDQSPPPASAMKKSETFKERNDRRQIPSPEPSMVKLRKVPSLSPDELNRRVEAFIEKFNHDMRLQRQASLDRLKEMMGRGL